MRIVVTGGRGRLGTEVVRRLEGRRRRGARPREGTEDAPRLITLPPVTLRAYEAGAHLPGSRCEDRWLILA
jgi:nucleoside-diphosphate-sugar epimerase